MESGKFEKDYEKLKALVKEMEKEDISLDNAFKNFEEATVLFKSCKEYLRSTEEKIKVLNGEVEEYFDDKKVEE